MATAPNGSNNTALVEHGSPDLSACAAIDNNVHPITQDEILHSGSSPSVAVKEKKKAPAEKHAPKKKQKKKAAPSPMPGSDNRISYDIHNLIIARDDFDFMKTGILPQTASVSGNMKKVAAPRPDRMTVSGAAVYLTTIFCPDCGLRVEKHGERIVDDKDDHYVLIICPDD